MKHLFHCPELADDPVQLPEEEARHATGVLRLRVGDVIGLLDGKGTIAEAEIIAADRKACSARILSRRIIARERKAEIHLAVAPTKQMERYEWFLEKATEIGVDRITPLITERTERSRLRHDRMERLLISAMKQSQRAWLPKLDAPMTLTALLAEAPIGQRFFGWCEGERQELATVFVNGSPALLLIGPEGDFTEGETRILQQASFLPVSLGEARLRTETAAIAACTWMNFAQMR